MDQWLVVRGGPVEAGLISSDVVDCEERSPPVLGLEGRSLTKMSGARPDPSKGQVCQPVNVHTENINIQIIRTL